MKHFLKTAACLSFFIPTAVLASQEVIATSTQTAYVLQIDCYSPHLSNTDTDDVIKVSFKGAGGADYGSSTISGSSAQVSATAPIGGLTTQSNAPKCDSVGDALYYSAEKTEGRGNVENVVLRTGGSDAFWMDEVYLYETTWTTTTTRTCSTQKGVEVCLDDDDTEKSETLIAHWGRDNGKGYCLSVDRADGVGDWENYVDQSVQCNEEFTMQVSDTLAFATGASANALTTYDVAVYTGTDSGAGTDSNIFLTINGSTANAGEFLLNPMLSGNAFENGDVDKVELKNVKNVGALTSIKLRSDGRYSGSGWQIKQVSVSGGGVSKTFNCKNIWLDGGTATCN